MLVKPEHLDNHLIDKLKSIYLVFGAEPLLIDISLEKIKKTAKDSGFTDNVGFDIDGSFDWNKVYNQVSAGYLFSSKRIIECKLTTGKIGIKGAKALTEIASSLPNDILLIVSTGKLDLNQQKSKWFKTLEKNGAIIRHWEVKNDHLVGWILNHMKQLGLESNQEVARGIASCTEGNLLASMQEIQKLKITYPDGKINVEEYIWQITERSRYTIYGLINVAMNGNVKQSLKIYNSLIATGILPIQIIGSLYPQLKNLIKMSIELRQSGNIETILQKYKVWSNNKVPTASALKRLSYSSLQRLLLLLGHIDRSIKGADNLDADNELKTLFIKLAGKPQWTQ